MVKPDDKEKAAVEPKTGTGSKSKGGKRKEKRRPNGNRRPQLPFAIPTGVIFARNAAIIERGHFRFGANLVALITRVKIRQQSS